MCKSKSGERASARDAPTEPGTHQRTEVLRASLNTTDCTLVSRWFAAADRRPRTRHEPGVKMLRDADVRQAIEIPRSRSRHPEHVIDFNQLSLCAHSRGKMLPCRHPVLRRSDEKMLVNRACSYCQRRPARPPTTDGFLAQRGTRSRRLRRRESSTLRRPENGNFARVVLTPHSTRAPAHMSRGRSRSGRFWLRTR